MSAKDKSQVKETHVISDNGVFVGIVEKQKNLSIVRRSVNWAKRNKLATFAIIIVALAAVLGCIYAFMPRYSVAEKTAAAKLRVEDITDYQPAELRKYLKVSATIKPMGDNIRTTRAEAYSLLGNTNKAISEMHQISAANIALLQDQYYYRLAIIYERGGKKILAIEMYEKAKANLPAGVHDDDESGRSGQINWYENKIQELKGTN